MAKPQRALLSALGLWFIAGSAMVAADPTPQTTRKIVFEKIDQAYRYRLTQGPVAALGDHQVLVHMRAVALNRGDWEILGQPRRRLWMAASPAVTVPGRFVAVGRAGTGFSRRGQGHQPLFSQLDRRASGRRKAV